MINLLKKYRVQIIYTVLFLYIVLLCFLTVIPFDYWDRIKNIDKLFHLGAYGLLSFIMYFALYFQKKIILLKKYPGMFTFLFTSVIGTINELFQILVPSRTLNILDILSNIAGILLTILVIKVSMKILKNYEKSLL
jgi:VanZ family protein